MHRPGWSARPLKSHLRGACNNGAEWGDLGHCRGRHALWAFDPKTLGIVGPTFATAGPNLLAVGKGVVLVIDSTGTVIGRGVFPGDTGAGYVWSSHVQVADLAGHTSDLVLGTLVGVLRPSATLTG